MILYHGSENIIKQPTYGEGKVHNDYGQGFYMSDDLELAKEWACSNIGSGYANIYEFHITNMNVLDLQEEKYNILHWITLLISNRKFRLNSPIMIRGEKWLRENFLIDISDYDVIKGYRADDSYFAFAKVFLRNEITVEQLTTAMELGNLGIQYMVKSPKAFENLKYIGFENAVYEEYFSKRNLRNEAARNNYNQIILESDTKGHYISDLIKRGERQE